MSEAPTLDRIAASFNKTAKLNVALKRTVVHGLRPKEVVKDRKEKRKIAASVFIHEANAALARAGANEHITKLAFSQEMEKIAILALGARMAGKAVRGIRGAASATRRGIRGAASATRQGVGGVGVQWRRSVEDLADAADAAKAKIRRSYTAGRQGMTPAQVKAIEGSNRRALVAQRNAAAGGTATPIPRNVPNAQPAKPTVINASTPTKKAPAKKTAPTKTAPVEQAPPPAAAAGNAATPDATPEPGWAQTHFGLGQPGVQQLPADAGWGARMGNWWGGLSGAQQRNNVLGALGGTLMAGGIGGAVGGAALAGGGNRTTVVYR